MIRLIAILSLLSSCSSGEQPYQWFENEWISDTETTLALNPEFRVLDQGEMRSIREIFGKIHWSISGNVFRYYDDRYDNIVEFAVEFFVTPINAERFKIKFKDDSRLVWKVRTGFCTVLSPDHLSNAGIKGENVGFECFRPAGA